MIGSPLALLGLLAVGVPIIIHLLGRHQSRVQRFPTLRFISPSRLVPTRRRRLSDIPLLLVRCAIVAVAALALSQPYFNCAGRTPAGSSSSTVSRAIIVDTSASMRRAAGAGRTAVDSANVLAASLAGESEASVIRSEDLRDAIAGASAWLATRSGTRQVTVISDFQPSAIDSADFAALPANVGVEVIAIPAVGPVPRAEGAPSRVALIYGRGQQPSGLGRADQKSMGALLTAIQRDPVVQEAAASAAPTGALAGGLRIIARNAEGKPVIGGGARDSGLVIVVLDDSLSLVSAALARSLARSNTAGIELDSTRVSDATLASWRREAIPTPDASTQPTDARWLWIVALLLIGLETWMRSRSVASRSMEAAELPTPDAGERAA